MPKKKTANKLEQATITANAPVPTQPNKPEAQKIWEEIQSLPIEMFALPNQVISQHCEPFNFAVDPNRLFLTVRSTATLPSLEASLNAHSTAAKMRANELVKRGRAPSEVKEYTVELADKFVIVSRATPSILTSSLSFRSPRHQS